MGICEPINDNECAEAEMLKSTSVKAMTDEFHLNAVPTRVLFAVIDI